MEGDVMIEKRDREIESLKQKLKQEKENKKEVCSTFTQKNSHFPSFSTVKSVFNNNLVGKHKLFQLKEQSFAFHFNNKLLVLAEVVI